MQTAHSKNWVVVVLDAHLFKPYRLYSAYRIVSNSNEAKSAGANSSSSVQPPANQAAREWKNSRERLSMKSMRETEATLVEVKVLSAIAEEGNAGKARTILNENSSAFMDAVSSLKSRADAMRALPIPDGFTNPELAKGLDETNAKMLDGKAKALSSLLEYGRTGQKKYLDAYMIFKESEEQLKSKISDTENEIIAGN